MLHRPPHRSPRLVLVAALLLSVGGCHPRSGERHPDAAEVSTPTAGFPAATPEDVGIPSEALERLSRRVQALVDDEDIVGGELMVVKNRRTVFQAAYGWKDREAGQALETDAVYCVRSMTKPLIGTAIQMLVDDGRLRVDTPVHEILPSFDTPDTRGITVEHLLSHTGGFPISTIAQPLDAYPDLAAVAAEAAATPLLFEPGTRFEYSDASADTLGAIVETLTGASAEAFIQERILDPLGMQDSFTLLTPDAPFRARIPSAYSGGPGAWERHWQPSASIMFPIFLPSQSLYSTTTDYARFVTLWMDRGRVGNEQLLSREAVARGLVPRERITGMRSGFQGLDLYYGQQWVLYADPDPERPQHRVFGHSGSDGTHAWVWPEEDLIVLFFTQSRGTMAGIALEPALQKLLVQQDLSAPEPVGASQALGELAGLYWDETAHAAYYVMTPKGRGLVLERPGRMRMTLVPGEIPGRYEHEAGAPAWVEFVRDEAGAVISMRTSFAGTVELDPKYVPDPSLPSVPDVLARVRAAHGIDNLPKAGTVQLRGTVTLKSRRLEGVFSSTFDSTHSNSSAELAGTEEVVVVSGDQAWYRATHLGAQELTGARRAQTLLDQVSVRYGDWSEHYESVEVLKRLEHDDQSVLLVRVVPKEGPGATMVVDEKTGRLIHTDTLVQVPGLGLVGVETDYGDFRDVGGMTLPFKVVATYATPMIGTIVSVVTESKTGVRVPEDTFKAPRAE
ncbi:MAG: serine hydrolase domain-containing protein [Nannocystales bacterium]